MMNDVSDEVNDDTAALVRNLRTRRSETTRVEVKKAGGGVPKNLVDTLSAFGNDTGGVILLGIDENDGYRPVDGFDAPAIRDGAVSSLAQLTPHGTATVEVEPFEGGHIVRIEVPELPSSDKPCFVTSKGQYSGSYTRAGAGEGDRRLSEYEVSQLLLNRGQPVFDEELVTRASITDLDTDAVARYCEDRRVGQSNVFGSADDETILAMTRVLDRHDGRFVPTLGGLLTLGRYPQQFFPQLTLSVVVWPEPSIGAASDRSERFLDSKMCDGPIPQMVLAARSVLLRNMSKASVVRGFGREDHYDYPTVVLRELLVNALLHRDYSPGSRGTPVQVELFPDRLEIRNPGGFFGNVEASELGLTGVSSSRNAVLTRLLSEVKMPGTNDLLAEDRGSGIRTVLAALRAAGMSPPRFDSSLKQMVVTVPGHALLSTTTLEWLAQAGLGGLDDHSRLAVAIARSSGMVTNAELQAWGLHPSDASRVLHGLVERGVLIRSGGRRYATYAVASGLPSGSTPHLDLELVPGGSKENEVATVERPRAAARKRRDRVLEFVRTSGPVTTRQVMDRFDLSYPSALNTLNRLIEAELVEPTAPPRSRKRRYVVTQPEPDASHPGVHR